MKNKLTDLNDFLFAQLERLAEEGLTGEQIQVEIKRAEAIVDVADKIVINARLQLDAASFVADHGNRFHLPMLGAGNGASNGAPS